MGILTSRTLTRHAAHPALLAPAPSLPPVLSWPLIASCSAPKITSSLWHVQYMLLRAPVRRLVPRALLQIRQAATALQRGEFDVVADEDIHFFKGVCGKSGVVTDPHELQPFNRQVCGMESQ